MKYINFTFKREATILVALHFGFLGVGIVPGIASYFFGFIAN